MPKSTNTSGSRTRVPSSTNTISSNQTINDVIRQRAIRQEALRSNPSRRIHGTLDGPTDSHGRFIPRPDTSWRTDTPRPIPNHDPWNNSTRIHEHLLQGREYSPPVVRNSAYDLQRQRAQQQSKKQAIIKNVKGKARAVIPRVSAGPAASSSRDTASRNITNRHLKRVTGSNPFTTGAEDHEGNEYVDFGKRQHTRFHPNDSANPAKTVNPIRRPIPPPPPPPRSPSIASTRIDTPDFRPRPSTNAESVLDLMANLEELQQVEDPMDVAGAPNDSVGLLTGRGMNASGGGGTNKYNYIPRALHEKSFTLHFQKVVRYDFPGLNEAIITQTAVPLGWRSPINSLTPATDFQEGWRYLPNMTYECYVNTQEANDIFQLAGVNGMLQPKHCSIKIFNTRLAMQLPLTTDAQVVTTDKPYFKVYEDTERILFGHATFGSSPANAAPCPNLPSSADMHMGVNINALGAVSAPIYKHRVEGTVTGNTLGHQMYLESRGGVEYYQAGDDVTKEWELHGPPTNLKDINGDPNTGEISVLTATAGNAYMQDLLGYIGATLPVFPINRYISPIVSESSTQGPLAFGAGTNRSESMMTTPNMLLVTCPTVSSTTIGATEFDIQTELQTLVQYNMTVEVYRTPEYSAASGSYAMNAGGIVNYDGGQSNRHYRRMPKGVYVSSRQFGNGPWQT